MESAATSSASAPIGSWELAFSRRSHNAPWYPRSLSALTGESAMGIRCRLLPAFVCVLALVRSCPAADEVPGKYAAAVKVLRAWIEKEVAAKRIPALSIALVED